MQAELEWSGHADFRIDRSNRPGLIKSDCGTIRKKASARLENDPISFIQLSEAVDAAARSSDAAFEAGMWGVIRLKARTSELLGRASVVSEYLYVRWLESHVELAPAQDRAANQLNFTEDPISGEEALFLAGYEFCDEDEDLFDLNDCFEPDWGDEEEG